MLKVEKQYGRNRKVHTIYTKEEIDALLGGSIDIVKSQNRIDLLAQANEQTVAGLTLQVGDFDPVDLGYNLTDLMQTADSQAVLYSKAGGNIASINLLTGQEISEIIINADQITVAGETTFLSALRGENFTTSGDVQEFSGDGATFTDVPTNFPTTRSDGEELQFNDLAFDTNYGGKPYKYNGASWIRAYSIIDGGDITVGTVDAQYIDVSGVISAGSIIVQNDNISELTNDVGFVDESNIIIRQDEEPTQRPSGNALQAGDIWLDTNDGEKPYAYNGASWVASYTSIDGGNIVTGTVTATQIDVDDLFAEDIVYSGSLKTDANALDGTEGGIVINPNGIFAGEGESSGGAGDGQTVATANVRIGSDGSAYFAGQIISANGSSIDGQHIQNLSITNAQIQDATIQEAKISGKLTASVIDVDDLLAQTAEITGDITFASAIKAKETSVEISGGNAPGINGIAGNPDFYGFFVDGDNFLGRVSIDDFATSIPVFKTTGDNASLFLDDQGYLIATVPTANPGGTGRIWSDSGTLKIT